MLNTLSSLVVAVVQAVARLVEVAAQAAIAARFLVSPLVGGHLPSLV